ncbi:MAG TPA: glycosyl hydrolase, partial [Cyclobacteriaceae bacterium]|nr:glycosyl hydrolase [Cyclobacteriaceae bacterium]
YIYIVYYDRRNHTNETSDVYVAWSSDSGASFKNVKISEMPFIADAAVPIGNYIGIAAHDGVVTPVWTRTENGTTSIWISVIKQADLESTKQ